MSYCEDRIRTLENFSINTKKILHSLRKYDFEWEEGRKIQFFKDFDDEDQDAWDMAYAEIIFISEGITPNSDLKACWKIRKLSNILRKLKKFLHRMRNMMLNLKKAR